MQIADKKFHKVMREFKEGKLYSHNKKVTDKKQAIAIAFSEARRFNKKKYHLTAEKGMLLRGPSHEDGGIAGIIKESGQPIEVEGDEMIINKRSTRIKDHITCKGTGEGIGSALNELGGGKKWSDEGSCIVTKEIEQFKDGNKMPKISSKEMSDYVARTAPFRGDGHIKAENVKGSYVVYSYGYYPLLVFKDGKWYENKEKYSVTTSRQLSRSRPSGISPEYKTTNEMNELIGETRTQSSHFYEDGKGPGKEKTKTIRVYTFDELSDSAKKKAIEDNWDWSVQDQWWETVYDDANTIGLTITEFDIDRGNYAKGNFKSSAEETAHKIEKEHGEDSETYKISKKYLSERDTLINDAPKDKNGDFVDEYELDGKLDDLDSEYKDELLEEYLDMLKSEYEYLTSSESISEMLTSNEIEFMEDGSRAQFKKGTKIKSHINKRKNESIRNIQRMVIRDGKLKKAANGEMVELKREDKLIKINRPQDFAIVSFLKQGSYPSGLKVFKHGDSICIYKNDPELIEFLNKYNIAYSEFDNYEEFYNWLTGKLNAQTKNKL